jgi:hypothetical protein
VNFSEVLKLINKLCGMYLKMLSSANFTDEIFGAFGIATEILTDLFMELTF